MNTKERELLIEIRQHLNSLKNERHGSETDFSSSAPNGEDYLRIANQLMQKVMELREIGSSLISEANYFNLVDVFEKEVQRVVETYKNSIKKRATKSDKISFIKAVDKANMEIHLALAYIMPIELG